jgi:hypothetical protein
MSDKRLIKESIMKVRRELGKHESINERIGEYEAIFLGEIAGVVLRRPQPEFSGVFFELISEDDGYWNKHASGLFSSSWMEDFIAVLSAAKEWCEKNCEPDMHKTYGSSEFTQFGWKFK